MSESSDDSFSGSDSDVCLNEKPKAENGKPKVLQQKKSKAKDSDSDSSDDEPEAQPVKKRKTLQDYLNEKVNESEFHVAPFNLIQRVILGRTTGAGRS